MITFTTTRIRWRSQFLCYRYDYDNWLMHRDASLCLDIEAAGCDPCRSEGRETFMELQSLTQRIFWMTTNIMIWQPPQGYSEGLADIINAAYPENRAVNDYEARVGLARVNEASELRAVELNKELRYCRASPRLVLQIIESEGHAITIESVGSALDKIHHSYGDQEVTFNP